MAFSLPPLRLSRNEKSAILPTNCVHVRDRSTDAKNFTLSARIG
jgi:hypothetical protein